MPREGQQNLFGEIESDFTVKPERAKRALDELFEDARKYRTSREFGDLLHFIANFRFYSPYNAMLVYTQMPGARFVASPKTWERNYGRTIKPGARPLVILQPKGPVMFVFDVSDTEDQGLGGPLPSGVERPFEAEGEIGAALERTIDNARRDGVRVELRHAGTQSASEIRRVSNAGSVLYPVSTARDANRDSIPIRYEVLLNSDHSRAARYATLVHELGHLYCGHLGTLNPSWWPARGGVPLDARELEAESVCYLVCERAGIENPSTEYLAGFVDTDTPTPPVALDAIIRAVTLIESMGKQFMKPRDREPPS